MPVMNITRKTKEEALREAKHRYPNHVVRSSKIIAKTYKIWMTPRRKK